MQTDAYNNFHEQWCRLKAFYLEVNNTPILYTNSVLRLTKELSLFQLTAICEIYQREATRLLMMKRVDNLQKYRKVLMKIFVEKFATTTWDELYTQLVDNGVEAWMSGSYVNWIDNLVKEGLIGTPGVARKEWLALDEVKATRNLLAHHKGIVNSSYINRIAEYLKIGGITMPPMGTERIIDHQYCHNAFECGKRVIQAIDTQVLKYIK